MSCLRTAKVVKNPEVSTELEDRKCLKIVSNVHICPDKGSKNSHFAE